MAKVTPESDLRENAAKASLPDGPHLPATGLSTHPQPPGSQGDGTKKAKKKESAGLFQFSNTEAIKEKVRQRKLKPNPYTVHNFYKDHEKSFFSWLAKHPLFENVTLGVIVVNALWISIDTDGNTAETILDAEAVYITADVAFFTYFSFELITRFLAFEKKKNCCRDGWFVFDTTLVTLYAFDPFTLGLIAYLSGGAPNLPTAVLRLCRLARLSRLIRMLRSLPELMVMIKGMVSAGASVGYTLSLLLIVTYVFSIALRNLVPPGSHIEDEYFSSVPEAMHNLLVFGTFLDNLSNIILETKEDDSFCLVVVWMYICLASLTVLNMLIGVLCEVISAVAQEEKESMMVDMVYEKFTTIVEALDENADGTLDWDEFQKILETPEALAALDSVNVDAEMMVDMAEDFFFEDGEPISVEFSEFMSMVLDLRGGQPATVKDIMGLGTRVNKRFVKTKERIDNIDHAVNSIEAKVRQLAEVI